MVMFIPSERAVGGRKERKTRAAFARGEKGLNLVDTSVMKRVIILAVFGIKSSGVLGSEVAICEVLSGRVPNGRVARARCSRSSGRFQSQKITGVRFTEHGTEGLCKVIYCGTVSQPSVSGTDVRVAGLPENCFWKCNYCASIVSPLIISILSVLGYYRDSDALEAHSLTF